MRDNTLKITGNSSVIEAIEKIASYKKEIIERNKANKIAEIDLFINAENKITYDDVLFDDLFWAKIDAGELKTENLEKWLKLSEIQTLRSSRNAQKSLKDFKRLNSEMWNKYK